MDMPQLTDAHRQLHRLVGNWEGSETLSPSPWDPAGGPAIGRSWNRVILDGFAVVHDYEQTRNGEVSFRGHGVFTWNPREQQYYLHWFDSMGTTVNTYRGRMEGDVLAVEAVDPEMKSRAFFDLARPDGYTFRMDVSPDGAQWTTFMEGRYARLPDAPRARAVASVPKGKSKAKVKAKARAKAGKSAKKSARGSARKKSARKVKSAARASKKKARKK